MIKQKRVYSSYNDLYKNHRISKWPNLPRRHIFPWRGSYMLSRCFFFLFDLILYVPVNNFSVMSGRVFLGLTSTKKGLMYLAQGHNAVTPVILFALLLNVPSEQLWSWQDMVMAVQSLNLTTLSWASFNKRLTSTSAHTFTCN